MSKKSDPSPTEAIASSPVIGERELGLDELLGDLTPEDKRTVHDKQIVLAMARLVPMLVTLHETSCDADDSADSCSS